MKISHIGKMKTRIKKMVQQYLEELGINLASKSSALGLTNMKELKKFLYQFRPIDNGHKLIRVGGSSDGGYLLPDDLIGVDACFSPGGDLLWNFEAELGNLFNIPSFICDSEDKRPMHLTSLQHYTGKWLGRSNSEKFISLPNWIETTQMASSDDLILQMDIEGAEYEILFSLPEEFLMKFRIIIIEFHALQLFKSHQAFETFYKECMGGLFESFDVVHSHPNNFCGYFKYGRNQFPKVIEVTFHRKDRSKVHTLQPRETPNPLDSVNVMELDEIYFPW